MVDAGCGSTEGGGRIEARRGRSRRLAVTAVLALALAALLVTVPASASAADCYGEPPGGLPQPEPAKRPLRFGIFPGGPAGVIAGPRPPAAPDDQGKIDGALHRLAG